MNLRPLLVLDDDAVEEVRQDTGGAVDPCYQCGTCTATCPQLELAGRSGSVRTVLRNAQLGLPTNGLAWDCTACRACEARCPRDVNIVQALMGLRTRDFRSRRTPPEMHDLLWSVLEDGNPWGNPRSHRTDWAGPSVPRNGQADVLLYVGCANSYDTRLQSATRRLAGLLEGLGIDYTILDDERCCGDSVRASGERAYLDHLIDGNVEAFNATQASTVLTLSPHCHDIIHNLYPARGLDAEVVHATQYLEHLLDEGTLRPPRVDATVAYHDPCYLGRHNGVYESPRKLLENVPGLHLEELPRNRQNALCCGGGGGGMWRESDGERLSDHRTTEARDVGVDVLATSCGYCIQNFEDSIKRTGGPRVMDVLELVTGGAP